MELKCAEHDGLVTHIPAAEELQAARYCKRFRASYLCECCRQLRGTAGQGCWWDLVGAERAHAMSAATQKPSPAVVGPSRSTLVQADKSGGFFPCPHVPLSACWPCVTKVARELHGMCAWVT